MIDVCLVDDHIMIRKGIRLLLETFRDLRLVGEASEGGEAVVLTRRLQPNVVLMDLSMPQGLDGFAAASQILSDMDQTKVILLTMHDEEAYVKKAVEIGAQGYILKKSHGTDLYEAIRTVHTGRLFYKTSVPDGQIQKWRKQKKSGKPDSVLTDREKEVVRLTILGFSNKNIAERLIISIKTVENHKTRIMQKLNFSSKHELVQYGINNHYLDLMR